MIREESRVAFIGRDSALVKMDDQGKVIHSSGSGAHVQWDNGQVTLEPTDDLFELTDRPTKVESQLDDALAVPGVSAASALSTFDESGAEALFCMLDDLGQLEVYDEVVEAARDSLVAAIERSAWIKDFDHDAKSEVSAFLVVELLRRL